MGVHGRVHRARPPRARRLAHRTNPRSYPGTRRLTFRGVHGPFSKKRDEARCLRGDAPMRCRPFTAILHEVFRASLVAPIGIGCVACSGHPGTPANGGSIDAAACSTPPWDGGGATYPAGSDAAACFMYTLPVTGDPAECGLFPLDCNSYPQRGNSPSLCEQLCHQGGAGCYLGTDGVRCVAGTCYGGACCGRRPQGLQLEPASGHDRVGLWFAELAAREEASIAAFEILADELEAHGAPGRLVAAAKRAARDETRHTRIMTAFAVRYGGAPRGPQVERGPVRSLEEIAIENAAEGCVRETFGALVGMWQARFAGDTRVRNAMKGVARDESRHAALSWEVARWIEPKLDAGAHARLEAARKEAMRGLGRELAGEADADLVRVAGIPSACEARRLFEQARAMLWMAAGSAPQKLDARSA
jgi:hypothetical protein